jgi:hypothetical protein
MPNLAARVGTRLADSRELPEWFKPPLLRIQNQIAL